ncbi:CopD family protein [Flavobacterium sp. JP2137]|uniref:CopD family protein n=1 Tax=Flavobacterium sp. JP2137 TaxID=3414510 RepID=UPI003D2FEAEA
MMSHHLLLILHLIAATIWVGGHLLLLCRYLPQALRDRDSSIISNFEKKFEPIGLPALLILLLTGVFMAYKYGVTMQSWFSFSNPIERVVSIKLTLLLLTAVLAVHARLFIIPKLSSKNLIEMAIHILLISLIGLSMLVVGSSMRFGGI